jgi:hypothetical protein
LIAVGSRCAAAQRVLHTAVMDAALAGHVSAERQRWPRRAGVGRGGVGAGRGGVGAGRGGVGAGRGGGRSWRQAPARWYLCCVPERTQCGVSASNTMPGWQRQRRKAAEGIAIGRPCRRVHLRSTGWTPAR